MTNSGDVRRIPFGSAGAPPPPSKIVAIGRNYREHAKELGNTAPEEAPLIFLKAPSALLGPGEAIVLPPESQRVDYEGELALVIGTRAKNWPRDRWRTRSRAFAAPTTSPRGISRRRTASGRAPSPSIHSVRSAPSSSRVSTHRILRSKRASTGVVKQSSRTSEMVFSPAFLVEYVTRMMTLMPGDLILTGTPAGIGPLSSGDTVEVEIEKIGILANRVVASGQR